MIETLNKINKYLLKGLLVITASTSIYYIGGCLSNTDGQITFEKEALAETRLKTTKQCSLTLENLSAGRCNLLPTSNNYDTDFADAIRFIEPTNSLNTNATSNVYSTNVTETATTTNSALEKNLTATL